MPLILGANSLAGGYQVKNSTRFASGDSLTRTVTASSATSYTVSFWLKLSDQTYSSTPYIFSIGSTAGNGIYLDSADKKIYFFKQSTSSFLNLYNGVLRDPSAWYHIVWSVSSGTGTGYINGITGNSHSSIPALNDNTGTKISIHDYVGGGYNNVGCYLSEYYFIDGQALTPSSFGETDEDTGIWKPKAYTGSFGTNGFYLDFEDSANLGNDMSGNNNDFTVNNLTSIDQTTDTPTNNFATMNPLSNVSVTLTEGNLKGAGAGDQNFRSTFAVNKGKWYWEVKLGADGGVWGICSENVTMATDRSSNAGVYGIQNAGGSFAYKRENGTTAQSAGFPNPVSGNIMNMAFDADNAKLYIGINGTYYNLSGTTGNPATSSNPTYSSIDTTLLWLAFCEFRGASQSCELNFGNPPYSANSYQDANGFGNFSYSVPSGFYSLNTKNLYQYGF